MTPIQIIEAEARGYLTVWSGMVASDNGEPVRFGGNADRTVQVTGTFNGATVVIEGSLDGANFFTLTDPFSDPLSFTAAGLRAVTESVRYMRPRTVGGGGSTAVDVHLFLRNTAL